MEEIPLGKTPDKALFDRSKVLSLVSDQIPLKSTFPEKRLLERLRLFNEEHLDTEPGTGPSNMFLAKEMCRREEQVSKKFSGIDPENEFSERSRNFIEFIFTKEVGIEPERAL